LVNVITLSFHVLTDLELGYVHLSVTIATLELVSIIVKHGTCYDQSGLR